MRWERLAALALLAVALGAVATYAIIAWTATPAHDAGGLGSGGIDDVNAAVAFISAGVPTLAVVAAAVAEALNMFGAAKREPNRGRM